MTTYRNNIIWQMLRRRGLYAYQAMVKMDISRPTLNKYFDRPENMNGLHRKKLASILGVDVALIDYICNGQIKQTAEDFQRVLDHVTPIKRKGNEDTE